MGREPILINTRRQISVWCAEERSSQFWQYNVPGKQIMLSFSLVLTEISFHPG